ncbi:MULTISPECIES: hypothetical protein [Butyricimonas]|uniref:hypothetical protein n=1 Tax=Butyricimonas TaxID=574697 RepID=UPI0007FB3C49|nr:MULTISPECIES: hypothetical protein [Butyricimonas]
MNRILILVVFAFIGGGLYANSGKSLSERECKSVATDTVKKGSIDFQKLFQAAAASGQKPMIRLTQNITPVNVSSTNKQVKVLKYVINDTICMVCLDVSGCKGKLRGIDTTAYLQTGSPDRTYKIKSVQEGKLPADTKTALTWDAKHGMLTLVFPPVKMVSGEWDWDLVLSTAKDGVKMKTTFQKR